MCRFPLIIFIPLPHSQEVPVYGLVSVKLIIWGADMSSELEEMKGLQMTVCPKRERCGALSTHLVLASWLFRQCTTFFSLYDWYSTHCLIKSDASPTQNKCCKSFFLACSCFVLLFASVYVTHEKASHLVLQPHLEPPTCMKSDFWELRLHFECGVRGSVPDFKKIWMNNK